MKYPVTTMPVKNFTLASRRLFNHTTPSKQDRRVKKKPRRNGASLPLLVPSLLARTRPFLRPRRSMRRSMSEPAVPGVSASAAGSTAGLPGENTASGYGHLTRSCLQDSGNFLQTHDQGPAGFVAIPPIRQCSTWEVAPRGGMVSGGREPSRK